ncbi:MAG: aminotransferase class III-fold pyridoxal phosphate-dependent enzyme [Armatimonadota bacterium]|nr:MAG: aminotransferase class III-fold pyridoxal phosphate-dependent enzyme [Armatimonadota bacterium]
MGAEAVEWRAEGSTIWDSEGREYLDLLAGFGTLALGHRPPAVVAAVKDQLGRMPLASRVLFNKQVTDLAAALAELLPGEIEKSFFCHSGAEAVEGAIKLARIHTGRPGIIAAQGGYHGKTMGALSASGRDVYSKPFAPLMPGVTHVPFGDAEALASAADGQTAAVILEPIQGEAGVIVPPDDYLPKAREVCDKAGALLILDEVQTGFGRTGAMFACERSGVAPDIICLAKALGGGVMPLGAFASTPKIWAALEENPYIHSSTLGGNPLACAAGLAALSEIQRLDLPARAKQLGEHALARLRELQGAHPEIIADVRGRGLLIGIQFADSDIAGLVIAGLVQRRVIAAYTLNNPEVIRVEPALTIPEDALDRGLDAFEESVAQTKELVAGLSE